MERNPLRNTEWYKQMRQREREAREESRKKFAKMLAEEEETKQRWAAEKRAKERAEAVILAETLPKHVIIQSNVNHRYLHMDTEFPNLDDALGFRGDYSFDYETRFELVPAKTGYGLFHILCLKNNRYWARFAQESKNYIRAMAENPEEEQSHKDCTLFRPIFSHSGNESSNSVLGLIHVNTSKYVRQVTDGFLCLMDDAGTDVYTFIDWESVVMLPNLIRIKGDNDKYLEPIDNGYMTYRSEADNSSLFDYEVQPSRDGGIRLKSTYNHKYWTAKGVWVQLEEASATDHDTSTVFLPTILDGNRIMMRSLENGKYCKRYTYSVESGLATKEDYPDAESYMNIEEPFISRKIENVRYHFSAAKRYNEKTIALVTDESEHRSGGTLTSELNLTTTVTNTAEWSTNNKFTVGGKVTFSAGLPLLGKTEFEVSAEFSKSWNDVKSQEDSLEVGSVKTITLLSGEGVKATLKATRHSYDVPFSYTLRDVLQDGKIKITEMNDGMFSGHNGYDYRYEVVPHPLKEPSLPKKDEKLTREGGNNKLG